jgi:phenylalanyl-tRNA synthetase beta chain
MKASISWLKQLVPQIDGRVLTELYTPAGIEVEGTHDFGAGTETCVLAWVVSIRPHPTKSGLRLVTVDRGGGTQEVICGAPNVPEPGGVVVLAPLGTHLPAKNMTIGRRDIGGVVSEGMLCSEAELGLSEDSSGILVLPNGFAAPGTRLNEAIPETRDQIAEIGLTPNRPDCLGHIGLAREAAALLKTPWTRPAPETPTRTIDRKTADAVKITIEAKDRCMHYAGSLVESVTVGPSPLGERYRLSALGVRSISNAVDVTNLIMLEYGHPMHAFDLDKVKGGVIVVRLARAGEKLVTLDGVERTLVADDLVIADGEGPIALAGVMGGASTEISATTKRVLLECASFDPRSVRRTARRHGLHSESSHRFERGIDHGDTRDCILHASAMTARLCGGSVASEIAWAQGDDLAKVVVTLKTSATKRVLGVDVPLAESVAILERLGLSKTASSDDVTTFEVPPHRPDITREIDLVEEIVRVRGMETVAARLPAVHPTRPIGGREAMFRRVRTTAVSLGLSEALTFGFTSKKSLDALGQRAAVELQNPLTEELTVMRTSLLPGLLEALSRARRHGESDVAMFTTGVVFLPGANLPEEKPMFAALIAGARPTYLSKPDLVDVWDAVGLATELTSRLVNAPSELRTDASIAYLHPRGAALIYVHDTRVGHMGPLHPDVVDALDLDGEAMVVELDLEAMGKLGTRTSRYAPIPRFPASSRDVALVIKDGILAGDVLAAVREAAGPLAEDVRLFDRFTGAPVPAGHASLAFRVVYRSADRTLTDAEIDQSHAKVVAAMSARFGATLRA